MGESVVARPFSVDKKMGESDLAAAHLEVSVSFGRFEKDSLSWEKWSSFSPNKYLEEVGKCSTPGSVAQKKAYFEAHYKKIAAKKAEQVDHEKSISPTLTEDESGDKNEIMLTSVHSGENEFSSIGSSGEDLELKEASNESAPPSSDVSNDSASYSSDKKKEIPPNSLDASDYESQIEDTSIVVGESDLFSNGRCVEGVESDVCGKSTTNSSPCADVKGEYAIACQDLPNVEAKKELNDCPANLESNGGEEIKEGLIQNVADIYSSAREKSGMVQGATSQSCQDKIVENSSKKSEGKNTLAKKNKNAKSSGRLIPQKLTPSKKEQSIPGAKKKAVSPATKPLITTKLSHVSTPGLSKSTIVTASQPSSKKISKQSVAERNFTSPRDIKKAVPTSLHMSLSLDTANPLASVTPMRKSLIMEQMGDKDIIRRAFKTFQKQLNGITSPHNGIFRGGKQVSVKDSEVKDARPSIPQKEYERLRKSAEKSNQRGDMGSRSNSTSLGLHKASGPDRKKTNAMSSSARLTSDTGSEKQQEKSLAKGAGKARPIAKIKVETDAQGKTFRAAAAPPPKRSDTKP